ncbi:patatin-like phospholipase family protein [Nocardiopsis ganjiahuensis]|uniref:patatin-like phospholipase family protein n=1 Tax=Nocardiopsis ganjiahuensis TaxID=239984 RepID=UPI000347E13A|nr:patatin-like phospholipase family protein [Nocardiopsis ganjiahuensis]
MTDSPGIFDSGSAGGHGVPGPVAFVLGGGGVRGAVEVGMIRALLEAGITPDLVVGTSIGAINGAVLASDPTMAAVEQLTRTWTSEDANAVFGDAVTRQLHRLVTTRTHLISPEPLRRLLVAALGPDPVFEDLAVPLRVVAASIERAAEHWFSTGPLIEAVLASASVPGLLPPTRIGGEHFMDGGIVNSIPIEAAVRAGAGTVYVLQVGRVEEPLAVPASALATARVAFEIARRHRFARDLATLPEGVRLHVLPSGGSLEGDDRPLAFRRMDTVHRRIDRAYEASLGYLAGVVA